MRRPLRSLVIALVVVCAVVGVFHPIFGVIVFGALFVVLAGILILAVCTPLHGGRR